MKTSLWKLQQFIWWAACTDEEAILLCSPVTQFYQTTVGMTVLITTVLAFISGGYAIQQITRNTLLTFPLAVILALNVFCIDRFIVSGRGSRMAWIRLPLALFMGCLIAIPLELRLVQERIDQELAREEQSGNQGAEDRRTKEREALQAQIARLEQRSDEYRGQINEWGTRMEAEVVGRVRAGSTGKAGAGSAYRAAEEQKHLNVDLLAQVKGELERLRQQQNVALGQIEQEYQRKHVGQSRDLVARYIALHAVERQHPEAAKMTWAITIFLILIDTFPALAKLMLPYTAYSALVEAREREDIQRIHSMANRNIRDLVGDATDPSLFVVKQTTMVQQERDSMGERRSGFVHEGKRKASDRN